MLHDLLPTLAILHDLDSRRSRRRPHPPNEHHPASLRPRLVREINPHHNHHTRSQPHATLQNPYLTKLRSEAQWAAGGLELTQTGTTLKATRYYSFAGRTVVMRTGIGATNSNVLISDHHATAELSVNNEAP